MRFFDLYHGKARRARRVGDTGVGVRPFMTDASALPYQTPGRGRRFEQVHEMAAVARIQELLGGERVTGPLRSDMDIVRLVRDGVPTQAVDHFLAASGLTFGAIESHVLPRRTFKRRQYADHRLGPTESDRLLRLVRVVAAAGDTFGGADKAIAWLTRDNRALDGRSPLSLVDTDQGAHSVLTLLGRIDHGLAA